MIRFLSFPLGPTVPVYGKTAGQKVSIRALRSLAKKDPCSTYQVGFENHWGTHVDCPAHFFEKGKKIASYPADHWRFSCPQTIKVALAEGELLTPDGITGKIDPRTDLLLFVSGWSKFRGQAKYNLRGPGVHFSVASFLRKRCPKVRAIGFDWISLSSFLKRDDGRLAHRQFLNPRANGQPILLIEDMDLRGIKGGLKEVWVAPWRMQGLDSAPCTIFGVLS